VIRHVVVLGTVTLLVIATAASCGVSQSSKFESIDPADMPHGLNETTTTSTTTTTTTTIPTAPVDVTTTVAPPTSAIEVELVRLYFVAGSSQLTPISAELARPATPTQVLEALLDGPPDGEIGAGLRSTIPASARLTVTKDRGTAIIDLPENIYSLVRGSDQRLMFAQLVLTIGQLGGIGQVQFTLAGQPTGVVQPDGTTSEPGLAVTADDYLDPPPPTTTVPLDPAAPPIESVPTATV
jgi:spore germination protein GerM